MQVLVTCLLDVREGYKLLLWKLWLNWWHYRVTSRSERISKWSARSAIAQSLVAVDTYIFRSCTKVTLLIYHSHLLLALVGTGRRTQRGHTGTRWGCLLPTSL